MVEDDVDSKAFCLFRNLVIKMPLSSSRKKDGIEHVPQKDNEKVLARQCNGKCTSLI